MSRFERLLEGAIVLSGATIGVVLTALLEPPHPLYYMVMAIVGAVVMKAALDRIR
jgi:hypothetical protein